MAKVCRKHKIPFYGLRCPACSAPPVLRDAEDSEEELPFKTGADLPDPPKPSVLVSPDEKVPLTPEETRQRFPLDGAIRKLPFLCKFCNQLISLEGAMCPLSGGGEHQPR